MVSRTGNIVWIVFLTSLTSISVWGEEEKIAYEDHVSAIFERRCFSCHNPDDAKGGLDLTHYGGVMTGGSGGQIVEAGDPDGSKLIRVITKVEEPFMPPRGEALKDDEISSIAGWISGGLLQSKDSKAVAKKKSQLSTELAATPGLKPKGPPPIPEWLSVEPVVVTDQSTALAALATSPWAPIVALSGQKQVLLYNIETGDLAGVLPFPEGFPETLSFSRNGSLLLAGGGRGGKEGRVVVWDVVEGDRVIEVGREFDTVLAADLSADHGRIALGGPSSKVKIYDTASGEEVQVIEKHTEWITALEYSPDGVLLATADRNGGVFVWESFTGNEFYELKGHSESITSLSWRADSNALLSASEDGTVRIWEMHRGKEVKNWKPHGGEGVLKARFAPQGTDIVTAGRDHKVVIWEGDGTKKKELPKQGSLPLEVAFDTSGERLIGGDWRGEVGVWNATTGEVSIRLPSNPRPLHERLDLVKKQLKRTTPEGPERETLVAHRDRLETTIKREQMILYRRELAEIEGELEGSRAEEESLTARMGELTEEHNLYKDQIDTSIQGLADLSERLIALEKSLLVRDEACLQLMELIHKLDRDEDAAEKLLSIGEEDDLLARSELVNLSLGLEQTRLFLVCKRH